MIALKRKQARYVPSTPHSLFPSHYFTAILELRTGQNDCPSRSLQISPLPLVPSSRYEPDYSEFTLACYTLRKTYTPTSLSPNLGSRNRPYPYVLHHGARGFAESSGSSYSQRPQADATRNQCASQHQQLFDMLILCLIACDLGLFPTLLL